ncbi:MAG TPA: galactokinase [Actinomycetales bacterium]|nr:galactokinase [Actinomycetales bacterium]
MTSTPGIPATPASIPHRDPALPAPATAALQGFIRRIGHSPAVVAVSPGRVNLIGEHTDYNAGLCLPFALTQTTAAAASPREDLEVRIWSLDIDRHASIALPDVAPGKPRGWAGYVAGTLWALAQAEHPVRGMDIVISSDVPVGAGLSSSAALEGSVAVAADTAFSLGLLHDDDGRRALALACRRAENEIVGAPTGGMDQTASLLARQGHALELDFRDDSVRYVPFDLASHGLEILVIDTRAHHSLADGQYGRRRSECEQAAAALGVQTLREASQEQVDGLADPLLRRRAGHVVSEIGRVEAAVEALERDDFSELGRLIDASHASLRDDYEVSCAELDVACEAALSAGALGARMTGGGFGGSAIALIPTERRAVITEAVAHAFAAAGFEAPHVFVATAGAGARVAG